MKKTKIMSVLLASALLAGCGNTDEFKPVDAGIDDSGIIDAVTATDSEADEVEEELSRDGEAGYFGTYINDDNCIITSGLCTLDENYAADDDFDYEAYYKDLIADRQLLYYSAERVIDQYNCIADRDLQGFFDSIDYAGLYRSENAPLFWAVDFLGEREDTYIAEEEMFWTALDYSYYIAGDKLNAANDIFPEDERISDTSYTRDEVLAAYREAMDEAAEKATFENSEEYISEKSCFNRLVRRVGSITNEEYFSSPERFRLEPSDDTIYIINMFNGAVCPDSDGSDVYVGMTVTVLQGDYAFDLGGCNLWLTENGDHVMPFPAAVLENPYKGKSMEEIEAERIEELRKKWVYNDPPTPAEAAAEGAWFNFNEGIYEGGDDDRTMWEKILGYDSYALSVSDEGLPADIDLAEYEDDLGIGDCEIVSTMHDYGYDSGTVWIRPEPDGSGDIYIIYESPDGQREEYHENQSPWF